MKAMTTNWVAVTQAARLASRVENPPVAKGVIA